MKYEICFKSMFFISFTFQKTAHSTTGSLAKTCCPGKSHRVGVTMGAGAGWKAKRSLATLSPRSYDISLLIMIMPHLITLHLFMHVLN